MSSSQNSKSNKENKRLRYKKKEVTKQAILESAKSFFLEKPMNDISVEDIAEAAFVSRTTVYNYFKNKDEIYFGLGTQFFKQMNEIMRKNFPKELPGIKQVLVLCKGIFTGSSDSPLINSIVREFYNRINENDLTIEEMHDHFVGGLKNPALKQQIDKSEEFYLIPFYQQLINFEDFWQEAVRKGKKDGSITNAMDNEQIVHYIFILIEGIIEQMNLRKTTLKRIALDRDTIINNSLDLISQFLKQTV